MDAELRSLVKDVLDNPDKLKTLTDDQIADVVKGINPYNKTLEPNMKYSCISYTNQRDRFIGRMKMVSLVSFVYRMLFESKEESDEEKAVIRKFLNRYFDFDPEIHVRSAQRENSKDPTRKRYTRDEFVKKFPHAIPDVPADTFFRWSYYEEVNYEEVQEMVNVLYCDKPDIDFAINCFGQFKTEKEALAYKDAHIDELTTDMHVIQEGAWILLAPYKENRKRLDFFNKDTQILKAIIDQNIEDGKLAKELMRKRVTRDKKKNIEETGPDDPGLTSYASDFGSMRERGGKQVLSEEERKKMTLDCGYELDAEGNFVKKEGSYVKDGAPQPSAFNKDPTKDNEPGWAPQGQGAASSRPYVPPKPDIDPDDLIDDGENIIVPVFTTDGEKFERTAFLTESAPPDENNMPTVIRK